MELKFPEDFYWGAATSSHQVEGGNFNDWTEWERQNAGRLAQEAKAAWQEWQTKLFPQMAEPKNYLSGRACDHYHYYEQDFDIAKQLNHNAHRFSVEWSRIEPEEGNFKQEEIEHYRQVIKTLRERGLEPFVTLWHWTNPVWVRDMGGWENKKTIYYFLRYVGKLADAFGDDVKFWLPINEPTVYAGQGYIIGAFPPGVKNIFTADKVLKNLMRAHKETFELLHKKFGDKVSVGSVHNLHYHTLYKRWIPLDNLAKRILEYIQNTRAINLFWSCSDFIGLNYYYRDTVKFVLGGRFGVADIENPNTEISDLGWDVFPEGIYYVLLSLKKYQKPVYITENGLADIEDKRRADFIREHLFWVHKAMENGVDVRGYFYWSLLDNFEWDKGFWPRFGLVEVDYKTLKRKIRPSAFKYGEICKNNAL